jgi:hypothetical protein
VCCWTIAFQRRIKELIASERSCPCSLPKLHNATCTNRGCDDKILISKTQTRCMKMSPKLDAIDFRIAVVSESLEADNNEVTCLASSANDQKASSSPHHCPTLSAEPNASRSYADLLIRSISSLLHKNIEYDFASSWHHTRLEHWLDCVIILNNFESRTKQMGLFFQ